MMVNEELSALRVTEVRTPRPDGSVHEEEIVADQREETMISEPPYCLEEMRGTEGAEIGLQIIDVPGGRMFCISRSINFADWGVNPVSMTDMKDASDAMNRWHMGNTFC